MTGTENSVTIVCVFTHKVFENPDSAWFVCKYRDSETDKEFTATGTQLPTAKDLPVKLTGMWTTNKKTGKKQLTVTYVEIAKPTSRREVIAYFVSLKCGIGKGKATLIYSRFGDKTWDVLDNHPEELKKISGISEKTYKRLLDAIVASNASRKLLGMFSKASVSVSGNTLRRIIDTLGDDAVQILTQNPYKAYGIEGFSFDKCDALAVSLSIPQDAPCRMQAFVRKVLNDATVSGHVCLPKQLLLDELIKQSSCSKERCIDAINNAFREKQIRNVNGCIYLPDKCACEESIAENLSNLMASGNGAVTGLDAIIDDYEAAHFKLADSQRDAIKMVFANQVSIITGGPGTGKTTVTNAVLYVHQEVYGEDSSPLLLAPTGKAARRMSEATGYPASTIHSAVGWRGDDADVECDDTPLMGNLILVDESSMMDQKICSILLERIELGARVVFIGDIDQLPSVGCGYVLHDMIASGVIPVTRLTVIYRQSGTNPIVANAHAINEGKTDLIESKTFRFIETSSDGDAFLEACKLYLRCVKAYGDESVVLLNPQRNNTDLSVDNFNRKLQDLLNPLKPDSLTITVNKTVFRAGDKVMELKNTAEAKNGDVGYIREIRRTPDPDDPTEWAYFAEIEFNGDGHYLEYTPDDLRHVSLAWCTTVHKAQGAEYPTVIQIISKSHSSLLKRNLVYTGITRARTNVALIGERDALDIAVKNNALEERHTQLTQRLRAKMMRK